VLEDQIQQPQQHRDDHAWPVVAPIIAGAACAHSGTPQEGRRVGRSSGRAGPANSADDEIVRLVTTDAHPEEILVATLVRNLSDRVPAAGAAVYPAERLRNLIDPD
jgi:hypothetical protein